MKRRPKPIQIASGTGFEIHLTGWPRDKKNGVPFLWIGSPTVTAGFVQDRDVKRLRLWCDKILKEIREDRRRKKW